MYSYIVKRKIKASFAAVNQHNYDVILQSAYPNLHHEFAGEHALGGARNTLEAVRRWFERLGNVLPNLKLSVTHMYVKGFPWHTTVMVRWDAEATLVDGSAYRNHGAHFITLRWGKAASIVVYEDTQAIAAALQRQAQAGVTEAALPKIES
jgi:ketosteroid isomerase-like protein